MNETLYRFAVWLDSFESSTSLHESYYMYSWIESTHVLSLMVFLGMLIIIDLRMLGLIFGHIPASRIAGMLDRPMLLGFSVMVITGLLLFYAIPVRTTNSIWFRIKVILLIAAGINALLFRRAMLRSVDTWDLDHRPPRRIRTGAALSLALWTGVIATGRMIAYDWWDCHQQMPSFMAQLTGCAVELQAATWN